MPRQPPIQLPFPFKGINRSTAFMAQPDGSTPDAVNVRVFDTLDGRARGGQRPGLSKFIGSAIGSAGNIQDINYVMKPLAFLDLAQRAGIGMCDGSTNELKLLNPNTLSPYWSTDANGDGWGVHFRGDGLIWSHAANNTITLVDQNDGAVLTTITPSPALASAYRSCQDKYGNICLVGSSRVYSYTTGGTERYNTTPSSPSVDLGAQVPRTFYLAQTDTMYYVGQRSVNRCVFQKLDCETGVVTNGYQVAIGDSTTMDTTRDIYVDTARNRIWVAHDHDGTASLTVFNYSTEEIMWRADIDMDCYCFIWYDDRMVIGGNDVNANSWNIIEIDPIQDATDGTVYTQAQVQAVAPSKEWNTYIWDMCVDEGGYIYLACQRAASSHVKVHIDDLTTAIVEIDNGNATNPVVGIRPDGVADAVSQRSFWITAVESGKIYSYNNGILTNESGGSADLTTEIGRVASQAAYGKMYFCDEDYYIVFNPDGTAGSKTSTWTPSAGSLPRDSNSRGARLIALYAGSIVLAGVPGDPHNWFMSREGDPLDWDTGAAPAPGKPTAGNVSDAGLVGDPITALIPYSDDYMIIGGDHSIYVMSGHPSAGGRIDLVSNSTGIAFGKAWCQDPDGLIYFLGTNGVYVMPPRGQPKLLTKNRLDKDFSFDPTSFIVRMEWDVRGQGLHLFITKRSGGTSTHWFWDQRVDAWYKQQFPNTVGPLATTTFDGDDPDDRAILLGGRDGYVRFIDASRNSDDGTAISSYAYIGPIMSMEHTRSLLTGLHGYLGEDSDDLTYEVYVGDNAQHAYNQTTPVFSGTWSAGTNPLDLRRAQGQAVFIKVSASTDDETWALEKIAAYFKGTGTNRQRKV